MPGTAINAASAEKLPHLKLDSFYVLTFGRRWQHHISRILCNHSTALFYHHATTSSFFDECKWKSNTFKFHSDTQQDKLNTPTSSPHTHTNMHMRTCAHRVSLLAATFLCFLALEAKHPHFYSMCRLHNKTDVWTPPYSLFSLSLTYSLTHTHVESSTTSPSVFPLSGRPPIQTLWSTRGCHCSCVIHLCSVLDLTSIASSLSFTQHLLFLFCLCRFHNPPPSFAITQEWCL